MKFLEIYRKDIQEALSQFFDEQVPHLFPINRWGKDVVERLKEFSLSGKLIRGALILFAEEMFAGKYTANAIKAAVSMELFQSGLLIHDDIMDQDTKRRGKTTIFYQYAELAKNISENEQTAYHFGESMGICVGDIAFFLGFENLSSLEVSPSTHNKIYNTFAREMSFVGLGQMQDIFFSLTDEGLSENTILSIYLYKTSRYTFSLPLMIGALLGGAKKHAIACLETIGENIGIIFQIKDDELGIFGDEKIVGKPIGSDIQENKKTLYFWYLQRYSNDEEKQKLSNIFGKSTITAKDVAFVHDLIKKYDIQNTIYQKQTGLAQLVKDEILSLPVAENYHKALLELLDYNLSRNF
ncbi:polyprenyl synthetase family protein [Thermospira aquatica]|uniref:Polyprenyl synthetase family protein n=1 Tax=Thermospira aquatica TaxID=2828656 RepID=A0AAX3BCU8_9SPIR|nr:polyprenyl synthetase family protein [Thermospira aquatica]URA09990.1 polyprenyl synthetase family protein [Thermospira aquatica]